MPPAGVTLPPLTYAHLLLIGTATRVVRYVNYASFTFMVWDMLLTLPDEVKYIWKARWTVIKVVFLSNRYVTPIILIGNLYTISGQAKDLSDQVCLSTHTTALHMIITIITVIIISIIFSFNCHVANEQKFFFHFLPFFHLFCSADIVSLARSLVLRPFRGWRLS
ncbi:hypothetical protein FRC15_003677 [Serendipita sp. 397]|nr:hypothetical protein FRC15_003677 [Serendipita sp. 397]